ncbi:helix-turn-helix domain-containing protein, partial [Streptomyces sp. NPDC006129]
MARPRKFDEERALDAAMRVFWERGYEATSTQDLCDATGLGRSSIYNTFQSKHDLFERALAHYLDTMTAVQTAVLDDVERPAADRVRALLDQVVESEAECRVESGRALGCLGVNTVVELAGRDPVAAAVLERDTARRLAAYRAV